MYDMGYEYLEKGEPQKVCDVWLKLWEAIKYRCDPGYTDLDYLDKQYNGSFFIRNICQELEGQLHNAGLEDKVYFEKRINYCQEFIHYFPDENEVTIHNMKHAIAETYASLGNYAQAELEFRKLVQEYPENPWSFVGWGDIYIQGIQKDYTKAKELYKKALAIAQRKDDIKPVRERLEEIEQET